MQSKSFVLSALRGDKGGQLTILILLAAVVLVLQQVLLICLECFKRTVRELHALTSLLQRISRTVLKNELQSWLQKQRLQELGFNLWHK